MTDSITGRFLQSTFSLLLRDGERF